MKTISDTDFGAHFKLIKDFPNIGLKAGDRLYLVGIPKRMNIKKATEGMFVWERGGSTSITLEVKHVEPWKEADDVVLMGKKSASCMTIREYMILEFAKAYIPVLGKVKNGDAFVANGKKMISDEIAENAIHLADSLLKSLSSPS